MTTPTMRVCQVTTGEDFTVQVTTLDKSTLDVAVVPCGAASDAKVRVVTKSNQADEYVVVTSGTFA